MFLSSCRAGAGLARAAGQVCGGAPNMIDVGLDPLRLMGWPPAVLQRVPVPAQRVQGWLYPGRPGRYYTGGSGLWPQLKACESAAWSLVLHHSTA